MSVDPERVYRTRAAMRRACDQHAGVMLTRGRGGWPHSSSRTPAGDGREHPDPRANRDANREPSGLV